jgi:hypothetical protein
LKHLLARQELLAFGAVIWNVAMVQTLIDYWAGQVAAAAHPRLAAF